MKANKTMKTQTPAVPARGVKPASNGNGSHPLPDLAKVSEAVDRIEGKPTPKADAEKAAALQALGEAWVTLRQAEGGLKVALLAAIKAGVTRKECVAAGVAAGYSESWAAQAVSHALDTANPERNKKRKGRPENANAKGLADYAKGKFGTWAKAKKMLLAAQRIAEKHVKAGE